MRKRGRGIGVLRIMRRPVRCECRCCRGGKGIIWMGLVDRARFLELLSENLVIGLKGILPPATLAFCTTLPLIQMYVSTRYT